MSVHTLEGAVSKRGAKTALSRDLNSLFAERRESRARLGEWDLSELCEPRTKVLHGLSFAGCESEKGQAKKETSGFLPEKKRRRA